MSINYYSIIYHLGKYQNCLVIFDVTSLNKDWLTKDKSANNTLVQPVSKEK